MDLVPLVITVTLPALSREFIKGFYQTTIKQHVEQPLMADKRGRAVNWQARHLPVLGATDVGLLSLPPSPEPPSTAVSQTRHGPSASTPPACVLVIYLMCSHGNSPLKHSGKATWRGRKGQENWQREGE